MNERVVRVVGKVRVGSCGGREWDGVRGGV